MKKFIIFLLSIVLWQNLSFANRQHVHQRLVIEGYNLLKKWMGNNIIPIMNDKIGDYSNVGINPWEQGFLTTGAWREDVEDVVYHYSLNNPPAISGFTANLVQALGWALGNDNNDGWISITHFWDADAGDESATNMNGSFYSLFFHNAWQVTVPNAYQKMKHYANGDFDLRIQIIIYGFPNGNGVPCATQWAWVNFRYGYLPTYFNNKVLRVSKIEWGDGSVTNYPNLPIFTAEHYSGLNAQSYTQFKDNICWEVLGRMCHLLQDMGVPAHANVDPHGDNSDLRIDNFENYFGDIGWTADMVYNINQDILDPLICEDPIHFLMYTTQQQANHFASNGPHMHQRNDVFAGNSFLEEINYLNTLNVSNYGNPIEMGETLSIENISSKMFPQIIRATAGLLYWFASETGLLPRVKFKNIFEGGTLNFNGQPILSGDAKSLNVGTSYGLTAISQSYNNYTYVWNNYSPNNKSEWQKLDQNSNPVLLSGNFYPYYSLIAGQNDNKSTYIAGLRKNFKINRVKQTEFDGLISDGVITHIVEQNSDIISAPNPYTPSGSSINYSFAGWTDDFSAPNPRNITPIDNKTYTALYKYPSHSNSSFAFTNNGQRKTIRTPDYFNTLHRVYESLGNVWYETSRDNGQNWALMNSGYPLDNGGGKTPSIDFITIDEHVLTVIVFQENSGAPPNSSTLKAVVYKSSFGYQTFELLDTKTIYSSLFYSYNTNPVLSICKNGTVDIVWEVAGDGLYHRLGGIDIDGLNLIGSNAKLTGTTYLSKNPSIAAPKTTTYPQIVHLVWEENNSIKHYTYHSAPQGTITTISSGDGYTYNNRPSVITLSDGGGRICWVGSRYDAGESDNPTMETRTIFRGTSNNHFWAFGNNVTSPNINNSDDETYYAIAWSEGDGSTTKFADNTLSTVRNLNIAGKDIQVRNGTTKNQMYADVFKSATQPYYFEMSNSLGSYYSPQKTTTYTFASGREGVIYQDTAQFYFTVGDIMVNEQSIDFIAIPDSIELNSKEMLNAYLVSETFQLSDNSMFLYSINYGASDSSAAVNLLSNTNKFINFKLQLVDAQSLVVLGSFDEVTFDQSNVFRYNNLSYQVNTAGIGNRSVFLRLKVEDNFNPEYSLSQIYSDNDILEKRSLKTINYTGSETPASYDLAQNFPNPFNPSTTIRYQLPKDGLVTLKIYDILGSEVATLVNEEKVAGRYEINFNASSLASGVYIYKIQAGDFVNSKKMILLK